MHLNFEAHRDTTKVKMATRIGTCHRVIDILISLVLGGGSFACAVKCIEIRDADETPLGQEEQFHAIIVSALVISIIQTVINVPYGILSQVGGKKTKATIYYMWAIYHMMASIGSCTLFYMLFYMVGNNSLDLRKTFWQQFKFKVDKVTAYQGILVALTDFLGLNCILTFLIVIYPKASKVWNRDHDDDVPIALN